MIIHWSHTFLKRRTLLNHARIHRGISKPSKSLTKYFIFSLVRVIQMWITFSLMVNIWLLKIYMQLTYCSAPCRSEGWKCSCHPATRDQIRGAIGPGMHRFHYLLSLPLILLPHWEGLFEEDPASTPAASSQLVLGSCHQRCSTMESHGKCWSTAFTYRPYIKLLCLVVFLSLCKSSLPPLPALLSLMWLIYIFKSFAGRLSSFYHGLKSIWVKIVQDFMHDGGKGAVQINVFIPDCI